MFNAMLLLFCCHCIDDDDDEDDDNNVQFDEETWYDIGFGL